MADLTARLDGLSPAKRKLLLERLREGAARREAEEGTGEIPRVAREVGGDLPLSFGQQQLWRIEQLAPGSPVYNVPLAASLEGDLDPAALAGALTGVLARHEVLRTRFEASGPDARPVLEAAAPLPLPQADLSGLPEALRRREAARLGGEETLRPFDLGRAPLLRALLLRLAPRSWTLHLTLHHIASDGWSVGVLLQDLAAFYAAHLAGGKPDLPPLPVQYADFAVFQRQRLTGDRLEALVAWWRERLTPPPPALELPLDRPRPPVPSAMGGQRVRVLPRLGELHGSQGATLFVTLLAGLQALLRRYSGQEDLAVGTPVAGRDRPELEGLIGYFVNTLVLRTSLAGDPTFRELLERSRETALGAWAHAELPFELLVERLRPERDPSRTPFFQVLLTLQNAPVPRLALPGLTLAPLAPEGEDDAAAKFDLSLSLSEEDGALMAVATYRRDLFEGTTIERLLSGFETLLSAAASDPDRQLSQLPVLEDGERHQLLHEWNDSAAPVPERSIYELLEEHAATHPEDIAVEAGPVTLTYGELSRRCRRLAVRLRAHGVGPEVPVGLLMDSSLEAVVAVLGVLAAGGAFVPLDPFQPVERIAGLLEETGAPVVLAVEPFLAQAPVGSWRVLPLHDSEDDKDSGDGSNDGRDDWGRPVAPSQAAYILYTSGSTGKPKGTVVSHRSIANYLVWAGQALPGPIALLSRLIFDACLKQLLAPFAIGSRVWVPVAKPTSPPELMAELAIRPGATINCAPSIWRALLESAEAGGPARLAHLLLGGEVVDPALLARTRKAIPGIQIHNVYGPTETTVSSTEGTILDHEPIIGRPVANNQIYLLGPHLELLPPGAVGELYIGGVGLARGYLGRPDLTAQRFLPDPFAEIPGERLYRTGDRVRQKPDGNLIVLGRFDDQIKIRGVRIEPGEVEAALARHPAVLRAAVLGVEDAPGAGRLVAFTVLASGATDTPEGLRSFLETRLPAALVPSSVQVLEFFPLTATGKTDRRALARLVAERPATAPFRPPATPTEIRLAEIWREILGAERIGTDDSFFELGGDSILALRLALRARESGLPLDAARLFLHPTIARLAADLDATNPAPVERLTAPTPAVGRRDMERLLRKMK